MTPTPGATNETCGNCLLNRHGNCGRPCACYCFVGRPADEPAGTREGPLRPRPEPREYLPNMAGSAQYRIDAAAWDLEQARATISDLTAQVERLTRQGKRDVARIRILARKAAASGAEIDEEIHALNEEEERDLALRKDEITTLCAENERLAKLLESRPPWNLLTAQLTDALEKVGALEAANETLTRERDEARNRLRPAEALADAVGVYVQLRILDARSRPADALLDYRNPPVTDETSAIAKREREHADLRAEVDRLKLYVQHDAGAHCPAAVHPHDPCTCGLSGLIGIAEE